MTIKRGAIYVGAIIAAGILWSVGCRHDRAVDQEIKSTTLPQDDIAKVIVDPRRHTITTVTRKGVTAGFLPRNGGAVNIRKDGRVDVVTRKAGTETSAYVGGAFGSDISLRAVVGLNLLYFTRWEAGPGVMFSRDIRDTRIYLGVTYNVYDNWLVGVAVDHRKTAHLIAGLRF